MQGTLCPGSVISQTRGGATVGGVLTRLGLQLPTLSTARTPTLGAAPLAARGLPSGSFLTLGRLGRHGEVRVQPGVTRPPSSMTSVSKDPRLFTEDEKRVLARMSPPEPWGRGRRWEGS